jgi:predicted PurR-regulated permease PerM
MIDMGMLRAQPARRFRLALHDPQPFARPADLWASAARLSTVGIFLLLFGAVLYFGRGLLLPVAVAVVIAETFAPIVSAAARRGVPRLLTAALLLVSGIALFSLAITLVAAPLSEWFGRAPELGASLKEKLYVFDRPLAALRELQGAILPSHDNVVTVDSGWTALVAPVVGFLTPALGQIVLFIIVLFFALAGERDFRNFIISLAPSRDAKLRTMRIASDIRRNLAGYLAIVSAINLSIGLIVTAGTWALGFPNPYLFGMLAAVLNYIPYLGSAVTAVVLFAVGLVIFPTLGHALIAPAGYIAVAAIEGQIVTPTILGRRLTLNPLTIILSLAFWTWMWGPMGAFIAAPMSIVALVTIGHLYPADEPRLPE